MKKILFSEKHGMFQAVLNGDKTMTRRIKASDKPRYNVGDVVYIAEPYDDGCMGSYIYKYGHKHKKELTELYGWKNKLFMPEKAARFFIRITEVRVERLQDISYIDCLREGIEKLFLETPDIYCPNIKYCYYGSEYFNSAQEAFADLINKINGEYTWEMNPCVFVYEFELTKI